VDLGPKIFFLWGSLCVICFIYAYLLIPETKGLTLEQVDRMLEETTPRTSAKWVPHSTFAADLGYTEDKGSPEVVQHVEAGEKGSDAV
jgi:Sugar (and other) transporter